MLSIPRCLAATHHGSQCSFKSLTNEHYCKVHINVIKKESSFRHSFLSTLQLFTNKSSFFDSVIPVKHVRKSFYLILIEKVLLDNTRLLQKGFNFKDIYNLCVSHPNGRGKTLTQQQFYGSIRSCIEEHSPSSRQYYFKGGKRTFNEQTNMKNLFYNEELFAKNDLCNWDDHSHVRGKVWVYKPTPRDIIPSQDTLHSASLSKKYSSLSGKGASVLKTEKLFVYK